MILEFNNNEFLPLINILGILHHSYHLISCWFLHALKIEAAFLGLGLPFLTLQWHFLASYGTGCLDEEHTQMVSCCCRLLLLIDLETSPMGAIPSLVSRYLVFLSE